MSTNVFIYWRKPATEKPRISKGCNPIFMHTWLYGVKSSVFGNDGVFDLGTKIFLQQVEHGRVLLLYTLMPLLRSNPLSVSHLIASHRSHLQNTKRKHSGASLDSGRAGDFSIVSLPHLMPMVWNPNPPVCA
jgi:hypothetical protein